MAKKPTYEEIEKQLVEQKDAIKKISKLNEIFSRFGKNPKTNIDIIVQHTCELLQGACCLYNRFDADEYSLIAWAHHNLPSDFNQKDSPDGHICYEVTMNEKDKPVVIRNIESTIYQDSDPNVKKYGLKSYLGYPVLLGDNTIGALCIVDIKKRNFSEAEIHIISTVAKAVSLEENRKQVEETLRMSESRYRLLAENVTDIIWTLDMNMNPTYYSPSITRLQGFTVEEALARSIEESMTPSSFDVASKVITEELEMLSKGQTPPDRSRKVDVEFYCKDGSTIWAEVEAGFIYDATGQPQGIIGVTRDITERKKAEDKLMKLHEDLEKRVEKRTRDIGKMNEVLEEKTIHLKEANTALKVLLKRREEDQAEVEEKILANVNELIIPAIDTLKGTRLDDRQSTWIEILETNLRDIVSPFSHGLSSKYWRLTPMEFQVANFIKNGKTTKEIDGLLHVATSTINTYRDNIREKLKIKNKKINLKTYLSDLE